MQTGSDILEHEPGDLTCIVEGGLRLSTLQSVLDAHEQRLSLDPPGDPTLAECLTGDLSGPLRHRFGTMRDFVEYGTVFTTIKVKWFGGTPGVHVTNA